MSPLYYVQGGIVHTDEPKPQHHMPSRRHRRPRRNQRFPVAHRVIAYLMVFALIVLIGVCAGIAWGGFAAAAISGSHDGIDRLADFLTSTGDN